MKNRFIFLILIIISCFFSCTTSKVVNNTFLSEIENKSDFSITIDNETVLSGAKVQHQFPVYKDGVHQTCFDYIIQLTESVSYILNNETILISNNQEKVIIKNPESMDLPECYVIIHNDSNKTIQITDERNNPSFNCYKEGIINGRTSSIKDITATSNAVCEIKQSEELYASDNQLATKVKLIKLNTPYKKGYVYTVCIEDDKATLLDCRPLLCLGEKSWQKEYKEEKIQAILQKNENIFILGFKTELDGESRGFQSGFLRCLDMHGETKWQIPFEKDTDTRLYTMTLSSNDSIIIIGRSSGSEVNGLILEYSLDGKKQKTTYIKQSAGFDMMMPVSDDSFILWNHNNDLYFNFNQNGSCNTITPKWAVPLLIPQISKIIKSESKYIEEKQGNTYIAGETADDTRSKATVVKISKDNKVESIYEDSEPWSFVSDIILSKDEKQLIMVGYQNARNSFGQGGTPFIRCLDLQTKEILWETLYSDFGYDLCMRITKCENYGYILLFAHVDDNGDVVFPYKIISTNATGKQF